MRIRGLIGVLAFFSAASPAMADVTLRYGPGGDGRQSLVVEADEQGRIRATGSNGQVMIIRDGDIFLVPPGGDGTVVVARLDDFLVVGNELFNRLLSPAGPAPSGYTVAARGAETVGTRRGDLYLVAPQGIPTREDNRGLEVVVSTDPALAEAGRASAQIFGALARVMAAPFLGIEAPEFRARVGEVLAQGAVLRFDRQFVLESVADGPVAASRFELPAAPLSREALRAQLQSEAPPPDQE